ADQACRRYRLGFAGGDLLPASRACPMVETAMSAVGGGHRLEQVAWSVRVWRLVAESAGVAKFRQIAVEQPRRNPIGNERLHPNSPAGAERAAINRARRHFRRESPWH